MFTLWTCCVISSAGLGALTDLCCHLGLWLTQPCIHVGLFDISAPSFGVALLMYAIEYSLHRLTEVTLQLLNCIDES